MGILGGIFGGRALKALLSLGTGEIDEHLTAHYAKEHKGQTMSRRDDIEHVLEYACRKLKKLGL
mgnify:CR=1 FL=1